MTLVNVTDTDTTTRTVRSIVPAMVEARLLAGGSIIDGTSSTRSPGGSVRNSQGCRSASVPDSLGLFIGAREKGGLVVQTKARRVSIGVAGQSGIGIGVG